MIVFPNAKINLGLSVTGKRQDGYHDIETVFYPIPLVDALEMVKAADSGFDFSVSGMEIPGKREDNLCMKAWNMLKQDFNLKPVRVHLHKAIPTGAGLGGGSSDAASMIKLVNDFFGLRMTVEEMQEYARNIGADCAFFIENRPVFAYERGDRFRQVNVSLKGYFLVLVMTPTRISTAEAYAGIVPSKPEFAINEVITQPVNAWKKYLINDFERFVFIKYPQIKEIKEMLYNEGAVYASMTGSGSAVIGIFNVETDLHNLFPGCFYWGCRL